MKIVMKEPGIFEMVAPRNVNVDRIHDDLAFLQHQGMLTFGDLTTRILHDQFVDLGYPIQLTDLCYEDDKSIGLQMPETWYLNRGLYAPSISMYFNFLNYKEMAKEGELYVRNAEVATKFGRITAMEIYIQSDLQQALDASGKRYFGTPGTLTECMRVLEGWDLEALPRLARYVTYSNFIRLWCGVNFPGYKDAEWGQGKAAAKAEMKERSSTNVREGLRFFWENYLEQRPNRIAPEDIEINIVDSEFHRTRMPRYVLIGEDIFADESLDTGHDIVFRSFTESKIIRCPRIVTQNSRQYQTAQLLRQRFPDTTVIMFKNPSPMPSFTMMKCDEVKEGISREVAIVASGLRYVHSMLEGSNDKPRP